jgi:ABC-type Fe3+-siderophore transport system permease subunit
LDYSITKVPFYIKKKLKAYFNQYYKFARALVEMKADIALTLIGTLLQKATANVFPR